MSYYTILNFEDSDPHHVAGTVHGSTDPRDVGAGAAAEGTALIYKRRAKAKSKIFDKKTMKFYACRELIDADRTGHLTMDQLNDIRTDVLKSKTVAFVIHGKPTDTDSGFATDGGQVATWAELGRLALMLLPKRSQRYNITLIMCYGGRSENAELDHEGLIPANDLRTSFAYKFFRKLCIARDVKMTAFTGAVSNDAALSHTVEREGDVLIAINKSRVMQKRLAKKAAKDLAKTQLINSGAITAQDFDQLVFAFANNPNRVPVNAVETFAKKYVKYSAYAFRQLEVIHGGRGRGNAAQYGKLVYHFEGGLLRIIARYATGHHGDNEELYSGPLL